jgi:hypothetical protein
MPTGPNVLVGRPRVAGLDERPAKPCTIESKELQARLHWEDLKLAKQRTFGYRFDREGSAMQPSFLAELVAPCFQKSAQWWEPVDSGPMNGLRKKNPHFNFLVLAV